MMTTHKQRVVSWTLLATALVLLPAEVRAQDTQPETKPDAKPEAVRGLKMNDADSFHGYTLFSPLQSKTTSLINMKGEVVHRWETQFGPGNSDYLLANGHLMRCARMDDSPRFRGGGIGGRVQEFDWDGKLVWDYVVATEMRHQHHDIEPLPNGHVLLIVWESKTREEALARGRDENHVGDDGLWPDAILEVEPILPAGGKIVWEWHVWDHLVQDRDPKLLGFASVADHPELLDINADHRHDIPLTEQQRAKKAEKDARMRATGYVGGDEDDAAKQGAKDGGARGPGGPGGPREDGDWLHTNSIDYDADDDLVLLSSPRLNEIFVIDHSTTSAEAAAHAGGKRGHGGDVLWRWGNPRNYGAGKNSDRTLFGQHDARWISKGCPGAGHILVFNNGDNRPDKSYSSVDEIVMPFDPKSGFTRAKGAAFGPKELAWTYFDKDNFFSDFISGADRLPNGDTMICEGDKGRMFEITRDGKIVWEYLNPLGGDVPMRGRRGPGGPDGGDRGPRGDDRGPGAGRGGSPPNQPGDGLGPDSGPPIRPNARPGPDGGPPTGPDGGPTTRRRGGPGGVSKHALFRATRIALDDPGVANRKL